MKRLVFILGIVARIGYAQEAPQPSAPASFSVSGDVSSPLVLKADDLTKMPRQTVTVQEHDGTKVDYDGVLLMDILKRAGAPADKQIRGKALASYLLAKAHDGYEVVFTLAEMSPEFGNETILLADKRAGQPLAANQGPLKLVCPGDKAGARSVRMVEGIEFVKLQK